KTRKPVKKERKNSPKRRSYLWLIVILLILAIVLVTMISNCQKRDRDPDEVVVVETKVEAAIKHAAGLLGVPERLYRKNIREDGIYISIALNPDELDLVFANMIVTGQVEMAGGEILSGTEASGGTAQVLRIKDPKADKEIIVRLYFERTSSYPSKAPKLAIIVDDFGEFAGSLLDEFLATDPNITFSILPDLRFSRTVMDRAAASGREVILHIPMEPLNYPRVNPGNNPILVEHNDREISRLVDGYVRHLPRVVGANNHMGSLATADERVMTAVLTALARHDLFFIDSRTTHHTVAVQVAQRLNVPVSQRDLFLDDPDSSEQTLRERLRQLNNLKDKRHVIVITHCSDRQRLQMLNLFVEEAKRMGFEIVPVSRLFISDLPEIL
ncbi:MAG: divergent polysaccharide deacetylase family protein, partial [Candidatus Cloacimonetes bacterium]|nr:divergent polysaccharide deacetylase family protein [Candidatus Cloacimonadota bacterium]